MSRVGVTTRPVNRSVAGVLAHVTRHIAWGIVSVDFS
jgi:hypothetical protein